jgi:hypothetical protein
MEKAAWERDQADKAGELRTRSLHFCFGVNSIDFN